MKCLEEKNIYRKKYITQTMWTLYMLLQTAVITLNIKVYAWMFGDQDNSDNKRKENQDIEIMKIYIR